MFTTNPLYDAEVHMDRLEDDGARAEVEAIELANRFIEAAKHGAEETLHGLKVKQTVADALYAVVCDSPELLDAVFYWVAAQTDNTICRALVNDLATRWASLEQGGSMSKAINTGGPAFPPSNPGYAHGMTLRDYFAAKAMQGSLAEGSEVYKPSDFAEWCYAMADAMLEAREKGDA